MGKPNPQPTPRHRFVTPIDRQGLRSTLLWFLVPFSLFLLIAGLVLWQSNDLKELHLSFQGLHSIPLDYTFKAITFLGDGIFVGIIALLLLLFVHLRAGLFLLTASVIDSVVVQYLKRQVFADHFRPIHYFRDNPDLIKVPGVEMHQNFSFPSGHTAAAFCLYFALALIVRRKIPALLFFVVALLVGYSRIYLNQHFLEDVFLGSIIGTGIAAMTFPLFYKNRSNSSKGAMDRPLIRLS